MLAFVFATPCAAQEKVRFPIGESSKTLSYGPLWVAGKMGFFDKEGLEVPIVTMRGSPLTIQALTADSIYVANATVDTLISAYEKGADITMIGGLINGLGLSMDRLFVEFQQLDSSSAKKYPGTGLGLALTKKIVEAQGGRVGARSTAGHGSVFFAILPKNADPAEKLMAQGETPGQDLFAES